MYMVISHCWPCALASAEAVYLFPMHAYWFCGQRSREQYIQCWHTDWLDVHRNPMCSADQYTCLRYICVVILHGIGGRGIDQTDSKLLPRHRPYYSSVFNVHSLHSCHFSGWHTTGLMYRHINRTVFPQNWLAHGWTHRHAPVKLTSSIV